jgi:hypothetical protein
MVAEQLARLLWQQFIFKERHKKKNEVNLPLTY